jgi:alpha-mannosidase
LELFVTFRAIRFQTQNLIYMLSLLTLAAFAMLSLPASQAQSAEEVTTLTKALPSASRTTIDRLAELNALPVDGWRFHAGDIAHGEAVSLDDSSWPILPEKGNATKDAVWFRREIEVPKTLHGYDLTGTRIWFQFHANANGPMPQIIYFNGRRVALGDDLEPIVLFDNAQPGEKVLVAVKILQTVDDKRFNGVTTKIDFAENRPSPNDLREEFLSDAVLVPSLAPGSSSDIDTLAKAIAAVDLTALSNGDQSAFDASLKASQSQLEALKPLLQQGTFHLTGNSHIDAAWLWPWTETVDVVKRTFGTAAQLMYEYPNYTYTQSAAQYNQWMADKYPALNAQIKERLAQGRWEIVGGMWVEPDLNMPDGESLVRQLLVGQTTFKNLYGMTTRIGWNPDSFGYTWQLPQIYKRSGVDYFVTQKMTWNDTNQLPFKLFWWESPDGSKVLAYFPHDYANNDLNPVRLSADLAVARERSPGMTEMMDLYGIGDHGGGPTRSVLDEGDHWRDPNKVVPKYQFGIAQQFFTSVEKQIDPDSPTWNYVVMAKNENKLPAPPAGEMSIPTWKDELYFEYHRGVFTTQADHKRNMRQSEEWLLNTEKYSSLAWLQGRDYPAAKLTDAWKQVLFNQFHDLAAGSGIGIIYKEAQRDYDRVRWTSNEASHNALETIQSRIDTRTKDGVPVLVFNPLAWERSGDVAVDVELPQSAESVSVLDPKGAVLPSKLLSREPHSNIYHLLVNAGPVPSMGYKLLHVVPGSKTFTSDLKVSGTTIENANLRVTVDPSTGCITSLFNKKGNFETLAPNSCGNELQAFKDTPKEYDAWNIDPGTLDQPPTLIHQVDSVKVVESGPMRAGIQVARTWQSSKFVQEISLDAGADEVLVTNDIDWHETHVLLKAAFALATTSDNATYEIPYGTIARPTTRNNSWEKAKFEVPAMRWADLGDAKQGMSLINESKYGYDAAGNVLRLSLLRSPVWPDPDADREHHHFVFALYPHAGDWKQAMSIRHGYELNYQLTAMQVDSHTGDWPTEHSFVGIDGDNVVLTAIKKAEDADGLLFRFFEWEGKAGNVTLHVPEGATSATLTNLMETPEGSPLPVTNNQVTVPITPFEIQTVRVDYPSTVAKR